MDAKLLQKIEEWNLYVIQLEKENKKQDAQIEELLKRVKSLNMIELMKVGGAKHSKLVTIVILTIIFCIGSCKKTWYCYGTQYNITAIKANDTIYNHFNSVTPGSETGIYSFNASYIDSVVSYYKSSGYNVFIDTSNEGAYNPGNDKAEIKALEDDGYKCDKISI